MSLALHVHPIPAPVCLHNVVIFLFGSGIQYTAQPLCIMSEGKLPKFHVSFVWLALGLCLTPPSPLFVRCPFRLVVLPVSVCAGGGGGSRGALCAVPAACPRPACAVCAAGFRASVAGRLCSYRVCLPEGAVTAVLGASAVPECYRCCCDRAQ